MTTGEDDKCNLIKAPRGRPETPALKREAEEDEVCPKIRTSVPSTRKGYPVRPAPFSTAQFISNNVFDFGTDTGFRVRQACLPPCGLEWGALLIHAYPGHRNKRTNCGRNCIA